MISYRNLATSLLALAALGGPAVELGAQSITTGAIAGTVVGVDDLPLGNVHLQLRPVDGGLTMLAEVERGGTFRFPLLELGDYELLAERLGYQPVLLTPLPVRPGRSLSVRVTLEEAVGPVTAPDTVVFSGRALAGGSLAGASRVFGDFELERLPQREADLGEMLRLSSLADQPLQVEGLPAGLSGLVTEGLPFVAASQSMAAGGPLEALLLPTRAAGQAELLAGRPDVEWPSAAGALLSAMLPSGTSGTSRQLEGLWSGEAIAPDPEIPPGYMNWRVGGSAGGTFAGDSAHISVFGQAQHHEVPVSLWSGRAGSPAALETAGLDVSSITGLQAGATNRINVGGRFGWRFAGDRWVESLVLFGQGDSDYARAGFTGSHIPGNVDATDLLVGVNAGAALSELVGFQVRVGYGQSTRDRSIDSPVETPFGDAAIAFAPAGVQLTSDPGFPGELQRSTLTGQGTVHLWTPDHHVKVGLGANLNQHDRTHAYARDGLYVFGSPAELADREGVFIGTGGSVASASFTVPELFGYLQDSWRIVPGLDLTTGVRYEVEMLPADDVSSNVRWAELTGLEAELPESVSDLALVAGFDWDVREQHLWRVRGAVAMQIGDVAPELLAEAITHDGRITATGAVRDVTTPVELGPRLTLLSPDFEPPTTTRASLGISRALGSTAVVHLDGVIRQTTNLPVRSDLNLRARAPFADPYGRPVFGPLERVGRLLYPVPGVNRRFGEFDAVSAISSSASSIYWGVTALLEKRYGWLKAVGSYTYSRTQDDWLLAGGGRSVSGSPLLAGADDDWAEGTSDFDPPHRLTLASELTLPFADMISVGAFWRLESRRPFTPGFGQAIDANADGVVGNDPAFVDESIEGMQEMIDSWDCLQESVGQFVDRNSCRLSARTLLDAWLGIRIPGIAPGFMPELRVEALALDAEGRGESYDTALFLLDPTGEVVTDPVTGAVDVPLMVNPRFGEPLSLSSEQMRFRISLRMVF